MFTRRVVLCHVCSSSQANLSHGEPLNSRDVHWIGQSLYYSCDFPLLDVKCIVFAVNGLAHYSFSLGTTGSNRWVWIVTLFAPWTQNSQACCRPCQKTSRHRSHKDFLVYVINLTKIMWWYDHGPWLQILVNVSIFVFMFEGELNAQMDQWKRQV